MSTEHRERDAFSIPEVSKRLGIGRTTAYTLAKRGVIPCIRLGGRVLVPRAALEELLKPRPSSAPPRIIA